MLTGTGSLHAGVMDKFNKFAGTEFTSLRGLYIMGGIIIASLVVYLLTNHFSKEDKAEAREDLSKTYHRRSHHHHRVIKKTA